MLVHTTATKKKMVRRKSSRNANTHPIDIVIDHYRNSPNRVSLQIQVKRNNGCSDFYEYENWSVLTTVVEKYRNSIIKIQVVEGVHKEEITELLMR